jgi:hypothetical protein
MAIVETDVSRIDLSQDGVLHWVYKPRATVTLTSARSEMETIGKIVEARAGQKVPFLIDIRNIRSITADARAYFASPESSRWVLRAALLTDSPISTVIGNFFLGLNRPPHPIRLFHAGEKAIAWLRESRA